MRRSTGSSSRPDLFPTTTTTTEAATGDENKKPYRRQLTGELRNVQILSHTMMDPQCPSSSGDDAGGADIETDEKRPTVGCRRLRLLLLQWALLILVLWNCFVVLERYQDIWSKRRVEKLGEKNRMRAFQNRGFGADLVGVSPPRSPLPTRRTNSSHDPRRFEDLRIAIFMTTHMSKGHIAFLERCWPAAMQSVPMLRMADCLLFATEAPSPALRADLFAQFRNVTVQSYDNPGYSAGAVLAMDRALEKDWFAKYDWIIRLNPDVIIRSDEAFRRPFVDDDVDAVLIDCRGLFHSDFFAIRPRALARDAFRRKQAFWVTAEGQHTAGAFREVVQTGRFRLLEGGHSNGRFCRVVGKDSPVIHDHRFLEQCPDLASHQSARSSKRHGSWIEWDSVRPMW